MAEADQPEEADSAGYNFLGGAAIAVVAGVALAVTGRTSPAALLVAVAVLQALLAAAWPLGLAVPGRKGAVVVAAMAAAGADAVVWTWPAGRLGTLLAVLGLAVPVLYVHQLARGAARVRALESLGGLAILVFSEVALPTLLQLRHEFAGTGTGADAVVAVVAASAGALAVGYLADLVYAGPRFDARVPRGLLAIVLATAAGAAIGALVLRQASEFVGGRGAFTGAALGVLSALFAVAVAFVERDVPLAESGFARRARPVLATLVPLSLLAPLGFLLCLAIRA
jgi:hypothetical protein